MIPAGYIESAIDLLKTGEADVVSIFYDDITHNRGTLEFGCSIWKTEVLKSLYDFSYSINHSKNIVQVSPNTWAMLSNGWCECTYMWTKVLKHGFQLATLPFRATHLKKVR